jgi:hypothetical protein
VSDCQVLRTCETVLALPKTRQMMETIALALKPMGIKQESFLSEIAAVWKYIDQQ